MNKPIILRPHQVEAINKVAYAFARHKRIFLQMPTGGGKTYTFWGIIERILLQNPHAKVVLAFHRTELLRQALLTGDNFRFGVQTDKIAGCDILMQSADFRNLPETKHKIHEYHGGVLGMRTNVMLCMVEGLVNAKMPNKRGEIKMRDEPHYIICDEAHTGNFRKVKEHFPNAKILGVSATPVSASKKMPLSDDFEVLIPTVQNMDLVRMGLLIDPDYITAKFTVEREKLKKDAKGEYDDKSQLAALKASPAAEEALALWYNENAKDKLHTLVFCVNIEHCESTAKLLDIPFFHSKNKNDHAKIMSDFKSGKVKAIATIGILATGFDFPPTSCIILNRATSSLPLYLQMIGRGTRISEGKEFCLVYDPFSNVTEHGQWGADREWQPLFSNKQDKEAAAGAKTCPKCEKILNLNASNCKFCGHIFETAHVDMPSVKFDGFVKVEKFKDVNTMEINELCDLAKIKDWSATQMATVFFNRATNKFEKTYDPIKHREELTIFAKSSPRIKKIYSWVNFQLKNANDKHYGTQC